MRIFISALLGALVTAAGSLVGRILLSLGIGAVVFTGVDASISWARDMAVNSIGALPGNAVRVASTMKIGTAISILSSALVARMTLNGLTNGSLKKFTVK